MSRAVALSNLAAVNPPLPSTLSAKSDLKVAFLAMADVSEHGTIQNIQERHLGEVIKGYTHFLPNDTIVAKITPCLENGKAVHLQALPHPCGFGSTEFHVLRPGPQINARFLFYMVWNPRFRAVAAKNMTGTAGQKRLPASFFERYKIPLLSIAEQRRIAEILDQADALRRKRRDSLALTSSLIPSIFHSMFSAGAKPHRGWPIESIQDVAKPGPDNIRTGPFGSQLHHSEFMDSGIPALGIDNVVQNEFRRGKSRCLPMQKYERFQRYRVFPGDVLVSIMGTIGRCAVAPENLPECFSTKHLCVITPDRRKVEPMYLWASILHDETVRSQTRSAGRGAIMEGLNMGIISRLKVRVPPLPHQREFAARVAEVRALEQKQRASLLHLDSLFHSLLHRAFTGEL